MEKTIYNSFFELSSERYSLRSYSDKIVEDWKVDRILKASSIAPTAVNFQPQQIYVIKSDDSIKRLESIRPLFGAKLAFIICYDENKSWKNRHDGMKDSGDVDCSIITTHMMLEAKEVEVDTCWIGAFNPEHIKRIFDIKDNIKPVVILLAGYPAEDGAPSPRHFERKDYKEYTTVL